MTRLHSATVIVPAFAVVLAFVFVYSVESKGTSTPNVAEVKQEALPDPASILREAVDDIVLSLDEKQQFWPRRMLIDIAHVQMWAEDFDGAQESLLKSRDNRNSLSLNDLAAAYALHGHLEQALHVVERLKMEHSFPGDFVENNVRLRWVEYLISIGELDAATTAIEKLRPQDLRADGKRKVAVAYAAEGKMQLAIELLEQATQHAIRSEKSQPLRQIIETQISLGAKDAATSTIKIMLNRVRQLSLPKRTHLLREIVVLFSKAYDRGLAEFFSQIEFDEFCDSSVRRGVRDAAKQQGWLGRVAVDYATAGRFDDATGAIEFTWKVNGERLSNEGFCIVSVAQAFAGRIPAALRTAALIEKTSQYRDDALAKIAVLEIRRSHFALAQMIVSKIHENELRMIILLKIANALAASGDVKAADKIASTVAVHGGNDSFNSVSNFDHREPRTWVAEGLRVGGTLNMQWHYHMRRAELAGQAMTLAIRTKRTLTEKDFELFEQSHYETIRELARAHAANGNASEALRWAKQIDNDGGESHELHPLTKSYKLRSRIAALVGVAEGILDRTHPQDMDSVPIELWLKTIPNEHQSLRQTLEGSGVLLYWQLNPYRD